MGQSRLFRIILLCFMGGVGLSRVISGDFYMFVGVIVVLGLIGCVFSKEKIIVLLVLGISAVFCGVLYGGILNDRSLVGGEWLQGISDFLVGVRVKSEGIINRLLAEPYSSLLNGVVVGSKSEMSYEVKNNFKTTGLTHIIAVSGYNVAIVIGVIYGILKVVPLKVRYFASLGAIFLFVIMTGASGSVLRAGVMGSLAITARYIGRKQMAIQSLVIACFAMVIIKPSILIEDIGFQLSVAATFGLIEIMPVGEKWWDSKWRLKKIPGWIKEAMLAGLAAQVMTIPIIIWYFSRLSLISPIANLLVVPIIPLVMGFGFVTIFSGFIWIALGKIVAWLAWLPLYYIVKVSDFLANLPYASIMVPKEFKILLIPYFLLILWWVYIFQSKEKTCEKVV